jgi:hypothetical protein
MGEATRGIGSFLWPWGMEASIFAVMKISPSLHGRFFMQGHSFQDFDSALFSRASCELKIPRLFRSLMAERRPRCSNLQGQGSTSTRLKMEHG